MTTNREVLAVVSGLAALFVSTSLSAVTLQVTTFVDAVDVNPGDGICQSDAPGGGCSLRAAVMEANLLPGPDRIEIPPGTYRLTIARDPNAAFFETDPSKGDLDITESLTIVGGDPAVPDDTVLLGGYNNGTIQDRAFQISHPFGPNLNETIDVVIEGLTVEGMRQPNEFNGGGAILLLGVVSGRGSFTQPTLTVRNVVFRGNFSYITGGAISNYNGYLFVDNCLFTLNDTPYSPNNTQGGQDGTNSGPYLGGGQGGAISNWSGRVEVRNSVFDRNNAQTGGAIYVQDSSNIPAVTLIEDSVILNNEAFMGAGIFNAGRGDWNYAAKTLHEHALVVNRVTIENNMAELSGGGVHNIGVMKMSNVTITGNQAIDAPGNPRYPGRGAGVFNAGRVLEIYSSTIAGNNAEESRASAATTDDSTGGDEIFLDFTNSVSPSNRPFYTFVLQDTIVGDAIPDPNDPPDLVDDNCNGPVGYEAYITSLGGNIDTGATCGFNQPTDLSNAAQGGAPLLAAAADNGVLTALPGDTPFRTLALTPGSVAVGHGTGCPGSDARRFGRVDGACDSGAFELAADLSGPANVPPTANPDLRSAEQFQAAADNRVFIDVLANDTDPDVGDRLTLVGVQSPTANGGTVTLQADGTLVYEPSAATPAGDDTFTYQVSDGINPPVVGEVTVVVYPPGENRPPELIAAGEPPSAVVNSGQTVIVEVLQKFQDPDRGDTLKLAAVDAAGPNGGSIRDNGNGTVNYTAANDFVGEDQFSVTVTDNRGATTTATAVIRVNGAPQVQGTQISVAPGAAVSGQISASDPEGDPLVVTVVEPPGQGSVVFPDTNARFSFTYTADAQAAGEDVFKVNVSDGFAASTAVVTVTFDAPPPANTPPVADDTTVRVTAGEVLTGQVTARDAEGDTLVFAVVDAPQQAQDFSLSSEGVFSYTAPAVTATTQDSFTFKANDGRDDSAVATVSITIEPPAAAAPSPPPAPPAEPAPAGGAADTPPAGAGGGDEAATRPSDGESSGGGVWDRLLALGLVVLGLGRLRTRREAGRRR